MSRKIKVSDKQIIEAALNSKSATEASVKLGIKYETFRVHAKRLLVFSTNPAGKGLSKLKTDGVGKISLTEILDGKHPTYQSNKLRIRLFESKLKETKCEECDITEWNGKKVSFELEHIDGNRYNHKFSNLKILCPNCHSQTKTYRGKNKSGNGGTVYTAGLKPAADKKD
jgi:Zn finger protein HypA/HybF involved in hydrogenase expression